MDQRNHLPRSRGRRLAQGLLPAGGTCAAGLMLSVALAWAQPGSNRDTDVSQPLKSGDRTTATRSRDHRIREGTEVVDQSGYFQMTGDRLTFFTSDGRGRFVGLENLNLDRIARAIENRADQPTWTITGTLTEFRGANFLLIQRAVLQSRTQSQDSVL